MSTDDVPDWLSNKTLFRWHGWIGLNLGLLLFLVCFSGTIAVFSYEIDWLIDDDLQVETRGEAVNWTAMADSIRAAYPYHNARFFIGPRHDGFASRVLAEGPAGRAEKLYVNPYTGEVRRAASFWNVQRFFRSFHRRMFAPNPYGIVWVTLFAFVLLGSAVTGILFYKGWYRHLFRLRWDDVRLLFSDGHRLAGVWSLAFATVIVATGVWYGLELVAPAPSPDVPEISEEAIAERGPSPSLLGLNEQVRVAKDTFPALQVRQIIPGAPTQATRIRGQAQAWLVRHRANRVRIDPVTGEVLSVQRGTEIGLHHRIADMADPLHFGTFGGWWSQGLWFVFGLLLSSLMLTGGWLWHLRAEKKARAAGAGRHPRWGYGAAALPIVVILASGVFGALEYRSYTKPNAPPAVRLGRTELGPWRAEVVRRGPIEAGRSATLDVYLFDEDGTPNPAGATATLTCAACTDSTTVTAEMGRPLSFSLPVPALADPSALRLGLRVEGPDGSSFDAQVPLAEQGSEKAAGGVSIEAGPAPIPTAVWLVIGAFVLLVISVVGGALVVAQRTARRRAEAEARAVEREARPAPVSADLPTSE